MRVKISLPAGSRCTVDVRFVPAVPGRRSATLALKAYMRVVVPLIARAVSRHHDTARLWRYYWDTIEACVPPDVVVQALKDAGFKRVRRYCELGIFSEYTAFKPKEPVTPP